MWLNIIILQSIAQNFSRLWASNKMGIACEFRDGWNWPKSAKMTSLTPTSTVAWTFLDRNRGNLLD